MRQSFFSNLDDPENKGSYKRFGGVALMLVDLLLPSIFKKASQEF